MNRLGIAAGSVFLFAMLILVVSASSPRENYGGPIKVLRNIPITTCEKVCENHFVNCMRITRNTDADLCDRRRSACKAICRYSDFQRL